MKCIYAIICPYTMKYVYVGKTINFNKRVYQHMNVWSLNSRISDWIQEMKQKDRGLIWEVLEFCKEDQLFKREAYWVAKLAINNPLLNTCVLKFKELTTQPRE